MKSILLLIFMVLVAIGNNEAFAASYTAPDEVRALQQPLENEKSPLVRAGDIYASCKHHFRNSFNTTDNIAKRASCNGYFFGTGGILLLLQNEELHTKTCIPEDISAHDLTKAFLEWAQDPQSDLNISAPEATLQAIRNKYKCG